MFWTHFYDSLLRVVTLIGLLWLYFHFFPHDDSSLGFLMVFVAWGLLYFYGVRTLASYLYCRLTLGMRVSLQQAQSLNGAFSPVASLYWLPMREIKQVDPDLRYDRALELFQQWEEAKYQEQQRQIADFRGAARRTQIMTVLMWLSAGYALLAGVSDLPPSNYLTVLFCTVFNTQTYYPLLNSIVMVTLVVLCFRMLDRNIKVD